MLQPLAQLRFFWPISDLLQHAGPSSAAWHPNNGRFDSLALALRASLRTVDGCNLGIAPSLKLFLFDHLL